jgi:hypothetical protein
MAKNERERAELYSTEQPPAGARVVHCAYPWPDAKASSVLAAMSKRCGVALGDFRLPIERTWRYKADVLMDTWRLKRPLLITRPLLTVIDRRNPQSARAKLARNPDPTAYAALLAGIRQRYFVISIADALPGHERVLTPVAADVEFHHGELDFETVAALTARAALVYCSPCFLTVLAQAVETPLVCVFGGFEGANSFAAGARYSPWLPIEPMRACRCWNTACRHDKTIDLDAATAAIEHFIEDSHAAPVDAQHARQPVAPARAFAVA